MSSGRNVTSFLCSAKALDTARVTIAVNEIRIIEPMVSGPHIVLPQLGRNLLYANDIYQRIYSPDINSFEPLHTTEMSGALYSAVSPGGGLPPADDASWSEVSGTNLGVLSGHIVSYVKQPWNLFTGLTYVDLWTWVYQPPTHWSVPFTIVHELWANYRRWNLAPTAGSPSPGPRRATPGRPIISDTSIRIAGRHRG